ncbi:glycosyltransferase family 25 protein [Sandarakinorhabdus sp.]|uniref:glycosyltransferase family 25 protein n=1 Tax=Sandarakinorhabdus sp. TaxID=1916663 RepID=UPI00286DDF69|nr:glycosyltransferase family 25 protein [Sandarakinorhabdus sp.]
MIAVRVISLRGSPRRAGMSAQLAAIPGLDWQFVDAAEAVPTDLPHDEEATLQTIRRSLTRGELGCFASHFGIWRRLAAMPAASTMVVLEDDLLLDPVFFTNLEAIAVSIPDIPYLRLHAKAPAPANVVGRVAGRHLVRYRGMAFGTQAYLLRQPAAARLVASITRIVRPIDDELDRYWAHRVVSMGVFPFPVLELGGPSTIEGERRGLAPATWREPRYQARRAVESLRRRIANLRLALGLPL